MPESVTTTWVVHRLDDESASLVAALDALGDSATTVSVTEPGGWTAKDVLAHLIHWEFVGRDTFLAEWPAHRDQMERARHSIT